MTLEGKGFFTYHIPFCERGAPAAILAAAQSAGLSHIIVKIAEGGKAFGLDATGMDFTAPVVQTLRAAGIAVWGWQNIHGDDPAAEAAIAITRTQALNLDGYVLEAGEAYQRPGMAAPAGQFMQAVRQSLHVPIAFSSYRFPNYHPNLPWAAFLEFSDLAMPKMFWEGTHNAGSQLRESKRQYDGLPHARPFVPTGAAYGIPGWSPTSAEISDFLDSVQALGLPAVNFFHWDACRRELLPVWVTIAGYAWPITRQKQDRLPAQTPIPTETLPITTPDAFLVAFLAALNSRKAAQVVALYDPAAKQVWSDQLRQEAAEIEAGFSAFFAGLPEGTEFRLSQAQVENDQRLLTWKAGPLTGETTLVLKNGKIGLDYTLISAR